MVNFLTYGIYRVAESTLRLLPLSVCFLLGAFLGRVAYYLLVPYRKLALHNLRIAFGDEKSPRQLRAMARTHFGRLGANFLSGVRVSMMSEEKILRRVTFVGLDRWRETFDRAGGGILATSHLSNWELLVLLRALGPEGKRSSLYQGLQNPYLEKHILRSRSRMGMVMFDRHDGFFGPLKFMKRGGGVGILIDQHAGDHGVWAPFFGRLASTSSLAPLLATKVEVPIASIALYTRGVARWEVVIGEAMEPAGRSVNAWTAELNAQLETLIRSAPEDWFWVHNRWKTPRPDFLLTRYRRGTAVPTGVSLQPFRVVVRSPNWLGDAVMSVPAVRAIAAGRPDGEVTILARENLRSFWEQVEGVSNIIPIEKGESPWRVAKKLRAQGPWDVAVLMTHSLRTALEVWGVPRRVGFAGHHRRWLLNQIVPEPKKDDGSLHHVQRYLHLAHTLGAEEVESPLCERAVTKSGQDLTIALCPGAAYGPAKRWFPERFAAVGRQLREEFKADVVLLGAPNDRAICEEVAVQMGGEVMNRAGETTLAELCDFLKRCHLLITNDTGTMHLAGLFSTPTIALFGSTDPVRTGPWGRDQSVIQHLVPCSPCFLRECPIDFPCMEKISAEEVVGAARQKLGELYGTSAGC